MGACVVETPSERSVALAAGLEARDRVSSFADYDSVTSVQAAVLSRQTKVIHTRQMKVDRKAR